MATQPTINSPSATMCAAVEDEASSRLRVEQADGEESDADQQRHAAAPPHAPQQPPLTVAAKLEVMADGGGHLLGLGPRQLLVGQHDDQSYRTAGILGRADDVVVGGGLQLLLVERGGVERIVQSRDAIETQLDGDGVGLVRVRFAAMAVPRLSATGSKRCPPATSTR